MAISGHEGTLSYGDLVGRGRALASLLRRSGAGPGTRVALLLDRSAWLVAAQMAVLEVGGAFVPLDPKSPEERLAFQLCDAETPIVLTRRALVDRLPETEASVVVDEVEAGEVAGEAPARLSAEQAAYVIYTSGSTGRPKGVEIRHRSLSQLVAWHRRHYRVTHSDRSVVAASPSFDASIFETWPYLTSGATLVIPEAETVLATDRWVDLLSRERVTIVTASTPLAEATLAELARSPGLSQAAEVVPCLRVLMAGGDRLRRSPDQATHFALVNHYGPTECSVVTTGAVIPPSTKTPPIGWPVGGRRVIVLDDVLAPVPMGTVGHLHVAGPGLANGYLGRAARTAASFVPDLHGLRAGERLYRTGDRVRHRGDGQLEFLGRIDNQVKLRGLRIELGEIESVLAEHPGVSDVALLVHDPEQRPDRRRLVAYLTAYGEPPQRDELATFLGRRLPDYMVPASFVVLERLPRTPAGKVDRTALSKSLAAQQEHAGEHVAPRSPVEEKLVEIWCQVLGVQRVSVYDNFFELGGHSLLATQVAARIRDCFGLELPLQKVFEASRVADLADVLVELQAEKTEDGELEAALAELEGLSEDEVELLLADD